MADGRSRDPRREAQWRRIIRKHARGGMTIREFCLKSKLRESAFHFWRRELQRRQAEGSTGRAEQEQRKTGPPAAPTFVAVRIEEPSAAAAGGIEIELPGGRRVRVVAPVDRQALADVLAVLTTASPERREGRPSFAKAAEGGPC